MFDVEWFNAKVSSLTVDNSIIIMNVSAMIFYQKCDTADVNQLNSWI